MKKIINFLLIIISICSFSILFNSEKIQEKNNIEKAERKFDNSYNILIPSDIQKNKEEQNVYDYIIEVIKKHNANIYYSKIGDDDKKIKFIYLSELSYFNNFEIAQGRSLNLDEMESDKFLSTEETRDKNQIGKISVFDGKQLFEIRTLKSIINSNYMLD